MSVEHENKALVRRFWEAQDNCDLETIDELLAPDFVDHDPLPGQESGREGFIKGITEDCAAHSPVRTTIEYQATDGDLVISRGTSRTVHDRGDYLGLKAPTGQESEHKVIAIHHIAGARSSRSGVLAALLRCWSLSRRRCESESASRRSYR
jgi:ketosteroid isomerase-like protein